LSWSWLHRPLESPRLYRAVQAILGGGGQTLDATYAKGFGHALGTVLDVGCGPIQETPLPSGTLVGLDVNTAYVRRYVDARGTHECRLLGVVGSAVALPFPEATFDECRSVAVLHHLPDRLATEIVREMVRVLKPGGRLSLFDMVRPESFGAGPLASMLCSLDRGRHVRTGRALASLVRDAQDGDWSEDPVTYAWPRLRGLLMLHRKPSP
jgi:SAM-dependent methyltransferase